MRSRLWLALLLLPAALFVLLLFCYPFLYGLQLSFAPQPGSDSARRYGTSAASGRNGAGRHYVVR